MKSSTLQALHSSASPNHGTPLEIVDAARIVLEHIDLDPASSSTFNELVKADRYFTAEDDGLAQEWGTVSKPSRVLHNPPGEPTGKLVKQFWDKLNNEIYCKRVSAAIWVGFSIDQLQTLQNCGWPGPLAHCICIPRKRLQFVKSLKIRKQADMFLGDTEAEVGKNPTKANFICLLQLEWGDITKKYQMQDRFRDEFERFGEVRT